MTEPTAHDLDSLCISAGIVPDTSEGFDFRESLRAAWRHLTVLVEAKALRDFAADLDTIYPRDVWPDLSADEIAALNEWATTRGAKDGSRFHVYGIRHAAALAVSRADDLDEA